MNWPLLLCIFILLAIGFACGWFLGHRHGHECGYEAGCADEITRHKPKIIEAKVQAAKIARTLCLAELQRDKRTISPRN